MKSLLQVDGGAVVPSHLRNGSDATTRVAAADALVPDVWVRLAQVDFQPLLDYCRPSTPEDAVHTNRCVATARVLATGNSLAAPGDFKVEARYFDPGR